MKRAYERDDSAFPADAYHVAGHGGIAWRVLGWETQLQEIYHAGDTAGGEDDFYEYEQMRTGDVVCVMVGDDAHWVFDPSDLTSLDGLEYCHVCGQIGCGHDGLDRSEVNE